MSEEKTIEEKREELINNPDATMEDYESLGESKEEYIARMTAMQTGEDTSKDAETKDSEEKKPEDDVSRETGEQDQKTDSNESEKKFGDPEELVDFNGEMITKTEKRRRDTQSYADKVIAENNILKQQIEQLQSGGVNTQTSQPKRDVFSEEAIEKELKNRGVRLPTEDEKFESPYEAIEMKQNYEKTKNELLKELKDQASNIAKYDEIKQNSLDKAIKLYPDLQDENSELRKACEKYADEHPELASNPQYELNIATFVASDLGILPSTYKAKKSEEENKEVTKKPSKPADSETYIMNTHKGNGADTGAVKKLTTEQFLALSPDEQDKYSKALYLETHAKSA